MNITDLRDELNLLADEIQPAPELSAGVARTVARTKRRRAAAAIAGACAAAVVAGVAVTGSLGHTEAPTVPAGKASSSPMLGADGMPLRAVADAPGDIVKDGLRYRAQIADDRLAVGLIGDRGQGQFTLVWQPKTTHVSVGAECYLPGLSDDAARKYVVRVGLEGKEGFLGSQCSGRRPDVRDLPAGGGIPGEPGQGWNELAAGRTARLRVQLVDATTGRPASVDGALLTGAVYELGEQVNVIDPATGALVAQLPRVREYQGYLYRLEGQVSVATFKPRQWIVEATPANTPFLVTFGSAGVGTGDLGTDRLKGLNPDSGSSSAGGQATVPQAAGPAHTVELVHEGPVPSSGVMLLATYTLVR